MKVWLKSTDQIHYGWDVDLVLLGPEEQMLLHLLGGPTSHCEHPTRNAKEHEHVRLSQGRVWTSGICPSEALAADDHDPLYPNASHCLPLLCLFGSTKAGNPYERRSFGKVQKIGLSLVELRSSVLSFVLPSSKAPDGHSRYNVSSA